MTEGRSGIDPKSRVLRKRSRGPGAGALFDPTTEWLRSKKFAEDLARAVNLWGASFRDEAAVAAC